MKGLDNGVTRTRGDRQRGGSIALLIRPLVLMFIVNAVAQPSAGLTINVNYNTMLSTGPGNDPFGTALMPIVQAAADRWESIILDPGTLTIDIRWFNPGEMSNPIKLASAAPTEFVMDKPSVGHINFNNSQSFFYDITPLVDEEYDLQQTLYGNVLAMDQTSWYGGAVPDVLEAGYKGGLSVGAPAGASENDLFGLAMHEMGHVLGMSLNAPLNIIEVADGDYDVNPAFVGGATMDIITALGHILPAPSGMWGSITAGTRRRMTATDVLAIASAVQWSDIDLRRKHYIGGSVFSDPSAWIGGKTPNFTSDALVQSFGAGGITVAQTSMQFQNLSVFDAWNVTALSNNVALEVLGTTTIDGTNTTAGTTKIVLQGNSAPGSLLDTTDLMIVNGGRLELDGQIPLAGVIVDQTLDIDPTSSLFGHGLVIITNDAATDRLNNHGLIEADGGTLRLAATNTINPVFDLDGDDPANPGNLRAVTGDLSVFGQHVGEFAGELRVGGGHSASFEHRFIINTDGFVTLNGNLADPATVSGADLVVRGDIDVDKLGRVGTGSDDLVTFEGPAVAGGAARILVLQADDELRLEGPTVFRGGQYFGLGTIRQGENITIASDTTFVTSTYDWGNSVPLTSYDTLVEVGATFTINSPTTGTPDNEYRGVITVSNGALEVNTMSGWTLPPEEAVAGVPRFPMGTLILEDRGGGVVPTVRGQAITVEGILRSTGGPGVVESDLFTKTTGEIDVRNGAELLLKGFTTYDGGNIHGPGTLRQNGNANIVGNTTITTTVFDWDGDEAAPSNTIIQPGVLFVINSSQIDDNPAPDGYDGTVTVSDTATLVVNTPLLWLLDGTMVLQGQPVAVPQAIVKGSTLFNIGTIQGNGWFRMSVINDGTIRPGPSAGTIRFEQNLTVTVTGNALMDFEIGGLAAITQFDQINIGGTGNINGTLQLSLINGFTPLPGDEFDIITAAGGVVGTFSSILFPSMPGVAFGINYDTNTVTITTGLIGDLDGDGFVGINDLNIVLGLWNNSVDAGVWGLGDTSGDGFIGIEDLNSVLGNWNAGTPPQTGTSIPEPGSAVLLTVSMVVLLRRVA